MMDDNEPTERLWLGRALKALREAAGLTQAEAGEAAAVTAQAWQNYELGRRRFTGAMVGRVTEAVGAKPQDLRRARQALAEGGAAEAVSRIFDGAPRLQVPIAGHVRMGGCGLEIASSDDAGLHDFSPHFGPDTRVAPVADGVMAPFVLAGGFVTYNLKRSPRHGQACVVHRKDGVLLVRVFLRIDEGWVYLGDYADTLVERFAVADVAGVYAVGLRGE